MNKTILDLIGNTPILQIQNSNIYVKLECFNPTGSIKDRAAKQMILAAIQEGKLKTGSIIIEPTSGNTGIGLAAIGRALGYKVLLTMPDSMSEERRKLLRAYGAELILTDGKKGMRLAIEKAHALARDLPNAFLPSQFENPQNVLAHYKTTGPELWEQLEGKVDVLVAGIGSGGTITGTGKYLKEKNPKLRIVGVEPAASPVLSQGKAGMHHIEGIGAGFVPKILDTALLDEIITVTDQEALDSTKEFIKREGILVGISSGAALFAAKQLEKRYPNKKIVAILPDAGNRYLSKGLAE